MEEGKVKLISGDGEEILMDEISAKVSSTIRAMLNSQFLEGETREITFPDITGKILKKVVEYCDYKVKYGDEEDESKIPVFKMDDVDVVELTLASNYLGC